MWMSADKRRLLVKETTGMPYLKGATKELAHRATEIRDQVIETVFDQFIKPDDAKVDVSTTSRWKRARLLWKNLLTETRASYFVDLAASRFVEWIRTGEAAVLPCTTGEMEASERSMPALEGAAPTVARAREIRGSLLKYVDELDRGLLERGGRAEDRQALERAREALRTVKDADWYIRRQPKDSAQIEALVSGLAQGKAV